MWRTDQIPNYYSPDPGHPNYKALDLIMSDGKRYNKVYITPMSRVFCYIDDYGQSHEIPPNITLVRWKLSNV
jgi:hypothetical protein